MAEHLVSIFGTEKDKINCPFYYKIGACRHGDRCSRIVAAARVQGLPDPIIPAEDREHHFDDFYDDIREEMERFGRVESVNVCENLSEHLAGNTYVKFADEESASAALRATAGRWYAGRVVQAEFSPVTDFREGKCRPFEKTGICERGDYCHFMHLRRHPGNSPAPSSRRDDREDYRGDRGRHDGRGHYRYRDVSRYETRDRDGRDSEHRYDRDRERHYDRDRSSRDRGRERERSRERDRRSRDYNRDRGDLKREYRRERSSDRDVDTGRDRSRDKRRRSRDRGRDRERERNGYRDYGRGDDRDVYRERRSEKRSERDRFDD